MQLKHYVKYYWRSFGNTYSKVEEIETRDTSKLPLGDLSIGDNIYALEIFDRLVGELDYEGKTYPVKTEKLNNELFYVGYFYSLDVIKEMRGNRVYERFIEQGYAGEIICQVAKSKAVPKEELETALAHLITPPHVKFEDLKELKACRAVTTEKTNDDSEITKK